MEMGNRFKTCSRNRISLWTGRGDRGIKDDAQVPDKASGQVKENYSRRRDK